MTEKTLDKYFYVEYSVVIEDVKGGNDMDQDTFATMIRDGNSIADILQRVPEDKRFLLSMMADAFLNGMIAQERLTDQSERPGG